MSDKLDELKKVFENEFEEENNFFDHKCTNIIYLRLYIKINKLRISIKAQIEEYNLIINFR